jgi:hypothetical protein
VFAFGLDLERYCGDAGELPVVQSESPPLGIVYIHLKETAYCLGDLSYISTFDTIIGHLDRSIS